MQFVVGIIVSILVMLFKALVIDFGLGAFTDYGVPDFTYAECVWIVLICDLLFQGPAYLDKE